MSTETYNLMTKSQEITVAALTVLGGSLSLLGSATIIYNIISKHKFKRDSYHRLLLAACIFDVISSVGWIMHTFSAPKESSERYLAIGNIASCTASGFLVQSGMGFVLYNACLAIYFLVTIRYNLNKVQGLRMERIMHAISIVWGLGSAILPLPLQLYNENEVGPGCWLNVYPNNCNDLSDVECIRGLVTPEPIGYAIAGVPGSLALVAILVSNFLVYRTARSKDLATRRIRRLSHNFASEHQQTKRTKSIASQATWYVVVYLNAMLWQTTLRMMAVFKVITRENESQYGFLMALSQFFSSSTGFGFLLVFVRPRYLRFRERDQLTRLGAFVAALSFDNSKRSRAGSSTWKLNWKNRRSSNPSLNRSSDPSSTGLDDSSLFPPGADYNRASATGGLQSAYPRQLEDDFQSSTDFDPLPPLEEAWPSPQASNMEGQLLEEEFHASTDFTASPLSRLEEFLPSPEASDVEGSRQLEDEFDSSAEFTASPVRPHLGEAWSSPTTSDIDGVVA